MRTISITVIRTARPAAGRWLIATVFLLGPLLALAQNDKQVWVQRFSTTFGSSRDLAYSIARDSAGNAVVAGDSDEQASGYGILVIKYSGAGQGLWTNRFNPPGNDHAGGVAVDDMDNVFVTGSSEGGLTLIAVTTNDAGNYTVVVSNPAGSVTSSVAVLSVILPDTPQRLSVNSLVARVNDFVLAWSTNTDGFTLQSATNLAPPVIWRDVTNPPVVLGGQYTVTNSRSASQQFLRLRKP